MQVRIWCLLLVLASCSSTYDDIDQFVDDLLLSRPEVRQLLVEVVRQQQSAGRHPELSQGRSLNRAGDTQGRFFNSLLFGNGPQAPFLQNSASFLQNVNSLDQRRCIPRLLCSAVSGIFTGFGSGFGGGGGGTATPAPPTVLPPAPTVRPPAPPVIRPPAPTALPPAPPSVRPPAPPTARPLPPAPPTRPPAPPRPITSRPAPPVRPPSPPTRPPAPPTRPPAPPTRPPAPPTRPPAPPTRPPAPPTRPPAPPTRPPAPPTRPTPSPPAPPTARPPPAPPVVRPPAPPVTAPPRPPRPPVVAPPAPPNGRPPAPPVGPPAPPIGPPAPPSNALRSEPDFFEKPVNKAAFGPNSRSLGFRQQALFDPSSRRVSLFAANAPILADDFGLTPVESRHSSLRRGRNELSGPVSSPQGSGRVLFIDDSGPSSSVAGRSSRRDPARTLFFDDSGPSGGAAGRSSRRDPAGSPDGDVFRSGRTSMSNAGPVSGRIRFEDDVSSGRQSGRAIDTAASSVEFSSPVLPSTGRRTLRQTTHPPSSGRIRFPERRRKKRTLPGISGFLRVLSSLAQPYSFSPYTTAAMEGSTAASRQDCARLYPQCPATASSPAQGGFGSDFIDVFNNLNQYAPGLQGAVLSAAFDGVPALEAFRERYR